MKAVFYNPYFHPVILILVFIYSCTGRSISNNAQPVVHEKVASQIADYVVHIYEDKKGNLWFGTMSKGVAYYDRSAANRGEKALTYFTVLDGLIGNTVVSITEDKEGNIWLGTHTGLSRFNPTAHQKGEKPFINFSKLNGLCHDRVSNILIDSSDNLWIGTWGGVCRINLSDLEAAESRKEPVVFTEFPLPIPDFELLRYQTTMDWITEVMEDSKGNIWFGRDGYGAWKYDLSAEKTAGKYLPISQNNFTQFSKKRWAAF